MVFGDPVAARAPKDFSSSSAVSVLRLQPPEYLLFCSSIAGYLFLDHRSDGLVTELEFDALNVVPYAVVLRRFIGLL